MSNTNIIAVPLMPRRDHIHAGQPCATASHTDTTPTDLIRGYVGDETRFDTLALAWSEIESTAAGSAQRGRHGRERGKSGHCYSFHLRSTAGDARIKKENHR